MKKLFALMFAFVIMLWLSAFARAIPITKRKILVILWSAAALMLWNIPISVGSNIDTVADWIKSLQYTNTSFLDSYGAVLIHQDPGHIDDGGTPEDSSDDEAYYRVVPYNSSLGVYGLLQSSVDGKLPVARDWINWYLDHLEPANPQTGEPAGIVYDHWYNADGSVETKAPPGIDPSLENHDDASDSYAATLLGVVNTYYEQGGDMTFLNNPTNKTNLETIAGVMLTLQDSVVAGGDGLTIAKVSAPTKFLMDNSEVYWGLKSMANLEEVYYGDSVQAQLYSNAADQVKAGIMSELYDSSTGRFRIAKFDDGSVQNADLSNWFLGTAHLAWPHLFGVIESDSIIAQAQMADISNNFDWHSSIVDASGFLWSSIGYAALLAGDTNRASLQADFIEQQKFPTFPYPWTVDDGGWLLNNLTAANAAIPEPSTIALLGIGLAGLAGGAIRRKLKKTKQY